MSKLLLYVMFVFANFHLQGQSMFSDEFLKNPGQNAANFERLFKIIETKKVSKTPQKSSVILENGYALSKIKNPQDWQKLKAKNIATQIEVVYTKYPKDKEFWLTNYHQLLADRLAALFELDASLNSKKIKYVVALQTQCETDEEARKMFHGIIIRYRPRTADELKDMVVEDEDNIPEEPGMPSGYSTIKRYIKNCGGMYDSMVYKAIERNKTNWKDMAVVCDWTASNYQYGAQSIAWHMEHLAESPINYFTFFNDGNDKYEDEKIIGETGGIYFADAKKTSKVMSVFNLSQRKGLGGEIPENDAEAILKTIEKYPEINSIAIVCDNSPFRDFELLYKIKMPVHVILQGTEWGINPQYINMAYITGGSLHTLKRDYSANFFSKGDTVIMIEGYTFRLDQKRNLYTCTEKRICEELELMINKKEDETLEKLKTQKAYRGMHKTKNGQEFQVLFICFLEGNVTITFQETHLKFKPIL